MPYKDPEKRREMQDKYYTAISIHLRKRDEADLHAGITQQALKLGIKPSEYLKLAAKEKLERDHPSAFGNAVAVTASPAELRTGITRSHKSRPRRRIRLGVIPDKPDKP